MSRQLRAAILLLLDERHRADPSHTVGDATIGSELGVEIDEVRRQLDILEDQGLTREANTFGGHNAWISPRGMQEVETLDRLTLPRWRATAQLRQALQAQRETLGLSLDDLSEAISLSNPGMAVTADTLMRAELGSLVPSPSIFDLWIHRLGYSGPTDQRRSDERATVAPVKKELLRRIAESPQRVFELEPREFEELVAEILCKMGLEVRLTPETRDGGRDILATMQTGFGELLAVVECKRYAQDRPVGLAIVERMIYTIREKDRASVGIIATTSRFTEDAQNAAAGYSWQLLLKDYRHLEEWLRQYGTYLEDSSSGLWLPGPYDVTGH